MKASSNRSSPLLGPAVIWLSALLVAVPFLLRGPACGADFSFHFSSWHDAANSWRHAVLYPGWAAGANFGAGEPRFLFYPPLTWTLGAALSFVLPWRLVPIALNVLLLAAAGLATRALARQQLPDGPATLAGATAIFSGYSLYEVYFHSDFALLSGGAWMPLLLLWLLKPRDTPAPRRGMAVLDRYTLPLALVVAGTWLSNAPLGLMACYVAAALALVAAWQTRSGTPLLRTGIAVGLGLGLASFYLVPAVVEQPWVDIGKLFARPEHLIENRWITSELLGPPHHLFPSQRARGAIEASMLLLALGGAGLVGARGRWPLSQQDPHRSPDRDPDRRWWFALLLVTLAVLFLMFPVSRPIWDHLPKLRYLEYPWRWLVVLQAPMSVFVAAAVWPAKRSWQPFVISACTLVFLAYTAIASTNRHLFLPCTAAASIAAMDRAFQPGGDGVGGTDEYASPPGAHNDRVAMHLPDACLVPAPDTILSSVPAKSPLAYYSAPAWSPALGTCRATFKAADNPRRPEHLHLVAKTQEPGFLVLRLRSYPAWEIRLNGHPPPRLPARADGLIVVPVPAGPLDLTVDWTATPDVLWGRWLTGASLLLAALLWWQGDGSPPKR